ncbi:hypothetical protein CC2G_014113 [Coprinopsis cinerea AmutBmut pab1-1]|nr:hypothetical protein CC2G_014113 [Coprinopsis cinerea AmutBmut pab1-1]
MFRTPVLRYRHHEARMAPGYLSHSGFKSNSFLVGGLGVAATIGFFSWLSNRKGFEARKARMQSQGAPVYCPIQTKSVQRI